jgi:hypothetical protein
MKNLVSLGVLLTLAVSGCGKKTDSLNKPATYDGTWSGAGGGGLHVQQVVFASNDFPCKGSVTLQYGTGQTFNFNVNWEQKDGQVHGVYGLLRGKSIATVKLDGETLSGDVTVPIPIPNAPAGLTFSGFKKTTAAR